MLQFFISVWPGDYYDLHHGEQHFQNADMHKELDKQLRNETGTAVQW